MTLFRVRRRKAHERNELTFHESFDLLAGPHRNRWGTDHIRWTTDAERREAWQRFGPDILRRRVSEDRFARGRRPAAFWQYDHPAMTLAAASDDDWQDRMDAIRLQVAYLARHALLEPQEIANIRSPHVRADGLIQDWDQAALDGLADAENTPDHDGGSTR